MKYWSLLLLFLFIPLALLAGKGDFPEPMNPPRLVNDFAGMLNTGQRDLLEEKLLEYERSSSTQITVVIVENLRGYEVADYAVTLFNDERWKPGQKGKDNGVLILVSRDDRKMNITTGYGLEGALPDAIASRIIRNEMTPLFKQQQYFEGLSQAADAIIAATKGEYKAEPQIHEPGGISSGMIFMAILIALIIFWLISKNSGNGGGGYMSKRGYRRWGSGNGPVIWGLPTGGGGGFGGGGFGGGGFGGFGGGSSGGGGASGSW